MSPREFLNSSDLELEFISGDFDINLPKEQHYLYKYFRTARQRAFVKYYLTYSSYKLFTDHTGYSCDTRWLKRLRKKLLALEQLHREAKMAGDFSTLASLESGQYELGF